MANRDLTITNIGFRTNEGVDAMTVPVGGLTVLVGPNNSGKSTALAEIKWMMSATPMSATPMPGIQSQPQPGLIITRIDIQCPSQEGLEAHLQSRLLPPVPGNPEAKRLRTFTLDSTNAMPSQGEVNLPPFASGITSTFEEYCRRFVMSQFMGLLTGRTRFALADAKTMTDLLGPPTNVLMAAARDETVYNAVDGAVYAALQQHLVLDLSTPAVIRLGLSTEPPPMPRWQFSTEPAALDYMRRATPIQSFGDGVQAFVGLALALFALPYSVLLVDEPEAFMHPTLARQMGAQMAAAGRDNGMSIIVATHSADFLLGCVDEVPDTSIVRLGFQAGVGTAKALSGKLVGDLIKDPLLRSADSLGALFSAAAVVCEADSDRAFYEEINRRLLDAGRKGNTGIRFLNAQNWQTIHRVAGPLRRLGVPAAMVLDLDTSVENGSCWTPIYAACSSDAAELAEMRRLRESIGSKFRAVGRVAGPDSPWLCKRDGIAAVTDPATRSKLELELAELEAFGIFFVRVGELEKWLSQFNRTNKTTWVTDIFAAMGSKGDPAYINPQSGDVWDFVERIAAWTSDPCRLGMP